MKNKKEIIKKRSQNLNLFLQKAANQKNLIFLIYPLKINRQPKINNKILFKMILNKITVIS